MELSAGHPDGAVARLPEELRAEGARLLGAQGGSPAARLGMLAGDGSPDAVRRCAVEALDRWQEHADDPLAPRAVRDAVAAVVRSLEAVLAELDAVPSADGMPSAVAGTQPLAG